MFAISPTDKNWFDYLKENELNSYVNFWTPTPWNITGLKIGDRLYFMLKSPIRKVGGFGEFVEYKNITAETAWNEFGYRNGRESKANFLSSIQQYIDKHSSKYGGQKLDALNYKIGCIVLRNCEFWDEDEYRFPENFGLSFPPQVVTIKYYKEYDPFLVNQDQIFSFSLVEQLREQNKYLVNIRNGQNIFKSRILKAYSNKCCITGEEIPELLEAAHIQNYRNSNSNHIQNGLLLRIDIHRLFDNNLLFIDKNYIIHISNLVVNKTYRQYHGCKIQLPSVLSDHPSTEALEQRRLEFRG